MTIRCKFFCTEIATGGYNKPTVGPTISQYVYRFRPVYANDPGGENKVFWDATPNGSFEITTNKPQPFAVGHEYYLDVTATT